MEAATCVPICYSGNGKLIRGAFRPELSHVPSSPPAGSPQHRGDPPGEGSPGSAASGDTSTTQGVGVRMRPIELASTWLVQTQGPVPTSTVPWPESSRFPLSCSFNPFHISLYEQTFPPSVPLVFHACGKALVQETKNKRITLFQNAREIKSKFSRNVKS